MLTNTTYEIQHNKTNEKKFLHRNHIVPYYPKQEKIQELVGNNVVPDDTDDYYSHYIKRNTPNLTLIEMHRILLFHSGP